ncbi:MAG: hypothetical protein AAF587_34870 [Bacteroidota bacterium]
MNRHMLIAIPMLIFMIASSCSRLNCTPEQYQYSITPNQDITYSYDDTYNFHRYESTDGEQLLFEFFHANQSCEDVFDDGYAEFLRFAVDSDLVDFSFRDTSMIIIHAHYYEVGAWVTNQQHQLTQGSISGTQLSQDQWQVDVDVSIYYDSASGLIEKEIRFSEVFETK